MNLMFRKNFREQKGAGGILKGSKVSMGRHALKRPSREQGYSAMEEHHYRTHLFFSPPRSSHTVEDDDEGAPEPRCGPMTGAGGEPLMQSLISPPMTENDYPQPLVVRSPSVSMLKWPTTPSPTKTTPNRQVSFNYEKENNNETSKSLSNVDRDCFIIPVHSLDRFLPVGVPMPKPSVNGNALDKKNSNLHVMEVADPKLIVLCHLMSPLEAIDPVLESPLVLPLAKQRATAGELFTEIAQTRTALTGMMLSNMEKNGEFPFITYYVINSLQTNPVMFYNHIRTASLTKFDPRTTKYTAAHTLDLYTEVASICRPPIHEIGTSLSKSLCPSTGYLVSVYKVFEGDDREKFDKNWLYWTGARMIYRYLPQAAGLRRISLHKSISAKGDKMYLLLCECSNLLNDVTVWALLLPALRARLTGYTGVFRPIDTF